MPLASGDGGRMVGRIPDKAYFRIGEVGRILGVAPYVIRYWESEFRMVRPERTQTAQRLYRRKDVETLLAIKRLLHEEHYTIQGAKRKLAQMRSHAGGVAFGDPWDRLAAVKEGLLQIKEIVG